MATPGVTLRIFVSSPGDVADERQVVGRVIERLQGKYWSFARFDDVFWENKVVRATAHYQDELVNPGACDIVVGIFWTRLGSRLPEKFHRASGERYASGTEWELEEAFAAYARSLAQTDDPLQARPDIVVYQRRSARPPFADPQEEAQAVAQETALAGYIARDFRNPDGTIRRPIAPYATLEEFEQKLGRDLEELVLRRIPSLKPGFEPPPISGPPFKNLTHFDFEDSDRFFGRNRAVLALQQLLVKRAGDGLPFVLIYGGSGYGKSSLMRAGLAPVLTRPGATLPGADRWRRAVLQPGKGQGPLCERLARALVAPPTGHDLVQARLHKHWPLTGVAEILGAPQDGVGGEPWDLASFARCLGDAERLASAVAAVAGTLGRVGHYLLLQIDQLEEVFTHETVTAADRTAFFQALAALARADRVWIVATMRSEYFARVAEYPALRALVQGDGGYILAPPDEQEMREMIRYPALAARLDYERRVAPRVIAGVPCTSETLDEQILADARGNADVLPLLEFTLHRLYAALLDADGTRRGDLLRWDDYADFGGLKGSIAKAAEEVFAGLDPAVQSLAEVLFANLVRVDAGGRDLVTRRRCRAADLRGAAPGAQGFLDAFVAAHLLVTDEDAGVPVVTLAHEALITHWPRLAGAVARHRVILRARQRLEENTLQWVEQGRPTKLLLSEGRLAEAREVQASHLFQITPDEAALLGASHHRARRRLRLLQTAVAVFAALAALAAWQWRAAVESNRRTSQTQSHEEYVLGLPLITSQDPDRAAAYLAHALELDHQNSSAALRLINLLRQRRWPVRVRRFQHAAPVTWLEASPDGRQLAVACDSGWSQNGLSTVHVWDVRASRLHGMTPIRPAESYRFLRWNDDGTRLLADRGYKVDHTVELIDPANVRVVAERTFGRRGTRPNATFVTLGKVRGYLQDDPPGSHWSMSFHAANDGRLLTHVFPSATVENADDVLAVENDGQRVLALTVQGALLTLAPADQRPDEPPKLDASGPVLFAQFSPGAGRLGLGTNNFFQVFDRLGKELFHERTSVTDAGAVEFSPGQTALLAHTPDALCLELAGWRNVPLLPGAQARFLSDSEVLTAAENKVVLTPVNASGGESGACRNDSAYTALARLGDDDFATGSANGEVQVWHLMGGGVPLEPITPKPDPSPRSDQAKAEPSSFSYETDRYQISETRDGTVEVRLSRPGGASEVVTLKQVPVDWHVTGVSEDADGTCLAITGYRRSSSRGADAGAVVLDLAAGKQVSGLLDHPGCAGSGIAPRGACVVTCGLDEVRVWNRRDGGYELQPTRLSHPGVNAASFNRSGALLATAGADVRVWSWQDGSLAQGPLIFPGLRGGETATHARVSDDDRFVVAAGGKSLYCGDLSSGQPVAEPTAFPDQIVEITPDAAESFKVTLEDGSAWRWHLPPRDFALSDEAVSRLISLAESVGGWRLTGDGFQAARQMTPADLAQLGTWPGAKSPADESVAALAWHFADEYAACAARFPAQEPASVSAARIAALRQYFTSAQRDDRAVKLSALKLAAPEDWPKHRSEILGAQGRYAMQVLARWERPPASGAESSRDEEEISFAEDGLTQLLAAADDAPEKPWLQALLAGLLERHADYQAKHDDPEAQDDKAKKQRAETAGMAQRAKELRADAEKASQADLATAPDQAAARLRRAEYLLAAGRYDEVLQATENLGDKAPAEPGVCRARALLALGRKGEAARAFDAALAGSPLPSDELCAVAADLRESGALERAVAALRQGLTVYPDDPVLHHALADLLFEQNSIVEASAHYRRTTELWREPDQAGEALAACYWLLGERQAARQQLGGVSPRREPGVRDTAKIGEVLERINQSAEAEAAEELLDASLWAGQKEFAEAEDVNPDSVLQQIGRAYFGNDRSEQQRVLKDDLAHPPESPAALFHLGRLADRLGDRAGALRLVGQAIAKAPAQARLLEYKSDLLEALGKQPEARAVLESAVALPDATSTMRARLAFLYVQAGSPEKARTLLKENAAYPHGSASLHVLTARVLFDLSDYQAAQDELEAVSGDDQENSFYRTLQVMILWRLGRTEAALECYDKLADDADFARSAKTGFPGLPPPETAALNALTAAWQKAKATPGR